jgi:deazaflavin-dependent oxidoreductase (nitroreductase family)
MSDMNDFNNKIIDEFRANAGVVGGMFAGMPMVLITHTGAKSGTARTTPLVNSIDNGDVIIIASMGGAPTNPAWYHNMTVNPTVKVEIGTDSYDADVVELQGDDRTRVWDAHCAMAPQFKEYEAKTTRLIPVLRLVRR